MEHCICDHPSHSTPIYKQYSEIVRIFTLFRPVIQQSGPCKDNPSYHHAPGIWVDFLTSLSLPGHRQGNITGIFNNIIYKSPSWKLGTI
ncbi:predicted protein [Sclerotinia sclerotiorum 1980 UF-70]|uniref:Uncharacterized protein n=1 Tax=Sclerotinia sclerotiorum (strain ATCC 18683 / 1980 / Ss-1) TaxID=665079 RepID=A7EQD8_SCLS1|nr:predicted protein [Sclerotinia sclerotiorum 1980 UF-70]EDN91680.1 predicted protein [Sclerotinia sclerotiorum 1980 UF-70]